MKKAGSNKTKSNIANDNEFYDFYHKIFSNAFERLKNSHYCNINQKSTIKLGIHYLLDNPGKFHRPMLCLLSENMFNPKASHSLSAALALEMIHSYSLIHDDLPCMDNDEIRRNKKTLHKVYDEATALLCGDALLSDAFNVLLTYPDELNTKVKALLCCELSKACGSGGMVLGQMLDLNFEKTIIKSKDLNLSAINHYKKVASLKTGKLFASALIMGAICGLKDVIDIQNKSAWSDVGQIFQKIGTSLGICYQICDDLKDHHIKNSHDKKPKQQKSSVNNSDNNSLNIINLVTMDECKKIAGDQINIAFNLIEKINLPSTAYVTNKATSINPKNLLKSPLKTYIKKVFK